MTDFFAKEIKKLGGETFFVGGCVRDTLLGITPKDIDLIVTGVSFEDILEVLSVNNVKHSFVGASFGVIKAKFGALGEVDIALPRKEISTGPGHRDFKIVADKDVSLEEDALRRDFTMNAMYINVLTNETVDPFDGRNDILRKVIRVTSNKSFEEDPLRILRCVQFCGRFNMHPTVNTQRLMRKHVKLLKTISPERIALELMKLLVKSNKPSVGLIILAVVEGLEVILPELANLESIEQPRKFHNANAFEHTLRVVDAVTPDLNMRFAALFHDLGKKETYTFEDGKISFHGHEGESVKHAERIIDRLKLFSLEGFDKNVVLTLISRHMSQLDGSLKASAIRRLVRKVGGREMFHKLIQLKVADKIGGAHPNSVHRVLVFLEKAEKIMHETPAPSISDLKIGGHDVMRILGITAGPKVGDALRAAFKAVENGEIKNESLILEDFIANMNR